MNKNLFKTFVGFICLAMLITSVSTLFAQTKDTIEELSDEDQGLLENEIVLH